MQKKIVLCIAFLTHLNNYSMLTTLIRYTHKNQQKRTCFTNFKKNPIENSITRHLNSCTPQIALEKTLSIILSPLQCTHEEKTIYIKSMLCRNDMSDEQRKTLTLLQTYLSKQKSHPLCDQEPLIHIAVKEDDPSLLIAALTYGFDIPNKSGDSGLYLAASQGQTNLVNILVYRCANPNVQNKKGQTPLHGVVLSPLINTSAEKNNALIQTMHAIKNTGACIAIKDTFKKRPIDYVHESLKKIELNRSRTLRNEYGELIAIYHEMEKILYTPSKNE